MSHLNIGDIPFFTREPSDYHFVLTMPPKTKRQKLDKPLLAGTLNKVESLTKEIQATSSKPTLTLSDLNLPNAREVEDLNPGDVLDSIEELVTTSVQRIMRNEPFTFTLPTHHICGDWGKRGDGRWRW